MTVQEERAKQLTEAIELLLKEKKEHLKVPFDIVEFNMTSDELIIKIKLK